MELEQVKTDKPKRKKLSFSEDELRDILYQESKRAGDQLYRGLKFGLIKYVLNELAEIKMNQQYIEKKLDQVLGERK
ncbi:hypothetical protein [Ammoniphilus resinae]|uniref:Uncharacterized protein n=1 Tax=Ammoniphilus resinae TaxID=861532 RepID=A0ABS4GXN1_9BACL|nr:hypothetical protein [Ammoniphilus resinae]MBP1935026.1 hypothetical protein [Ammoniphilus resinae]